MKKPFFVTFILITLFIHGVFAQINIGGTPYGLSEAAKSLTEEVPFVVTPALDMQAIVAEDEREDHGIHKIGRRFGIEHDVDYGLHNAGVWSCLPDGGKLWRLGVECPEALSINLIFDQYLLPSGATLYLFDENGKDILGGFTDYNNQEDGFFATSLIFSDRIIIEYYQPADAEFDGALHLQQIIHGYRGAGEFLKNGKGFGQSGYCQRNVRCEEGEGWEDQIRSVFCFLSGGRELCSGAMINNTEEDGRPYALTAYHCWDAAQNPGTWVLRFNWESPTCENPSSNPPFQTMSGATLKALWENTDFCLVELNQRIPDNYDAYFSGWSRSDQPSPTAMCIHHPALDIKKISPAGQLSINGRYWFAPWSTGACTEGGSSGSPLFDANQRIIGQLLGGSSYCGAPTSMMNDVYGRVDLSWDGGGTPETRLKDWLDPLESNVEYLNGYQPDLLMNDAMLVEILDVADKYYCIQKITPKVVIQNKGRNALTNAAISYQLNDAAPVSMLWTGNLQQEEKEEVVLPAFTSEYGNHAIVFSIKIENDEIPYNNDLSKEIEVKNCVVAAFPFIEDFENDGEMPDCIENKPSAGESVWKIAKSGQNGAGNPTEPFSGDYNARFYSSTYDEAAILVLYLDFSALKNPQIHFRYAQGKRGSSGDILRVYFKKDVNDEAWTLLKEFSEPISEWTQAFVNIPSSVEIGAVAFEGYSQNGAGVVIDEIIIDENPNAIECAELQNIRIFPNPANTQLFVEGADIKSFEIYNLSGQLIESKAKINNSFIDVSHYDSGFYLIKIITTQGNSVVKRVNITH